MTKPQMIEEILQAAQANRIGFKSEKHLNRRMPDLGDTFFALAFRTESELRSICSELHINTRR